MGLKTLRPSQGGRCRTSIDGALKGLAPSVGFRYGEKGPGNRQMGFAGVVEGLRC